jgi:hypothetical protein
MSMDGRWQVRRMEHVTRMNGNNGIPPMENKWTVKKGTNLRNMWGNRTRDVKKSDDMRLFVKEKKRGGGYGIRWGGMECDGDREEWMMGEEERLRYLNRIEEVEIRMRMWI